MLHDNVYHRLNPKNFSRAPKFIQEELQNFHAAGKPVGFYFDPIVKEMSQELSETALEFTRNGLILPPFKSFLLHVPKALVSKSGEIADYILWVRSIDGDRLEYLYIGEAQGRLGVHCWKGGISLKSASFYAVILEKEEDGDDPLQSAQRYGTIALLLLMMLNHPVYEKKEHDIDEALQRSRIKRGKETLSKYIYVNMKPHIKAALTAGDGSIRVPHWRRGHVRRLADGRVVPVQACIVNWEGEATDPGAPEKKIYVI